jgi:Pyruvate/2-oxoacid:ferredoxin oxidoreductase delta subunit
MKSENEIKYKLEPKPAHKSEFFRVHKPEVDQKVVKTQPIEELVRVAMVCPHGAIEAGDKLLKIDYGLCDGCLICLRECHFGAIKEEREPQ